MPLYEYECECGDWYAHTFPINDRPAAVPCDCGRMAGWRISAPAIHTAATFVREIRDESVQRSVACDGSYIDPNLSYNRDGTVTPITSPKHREEVMRAKGLYELPQTDMTREVDRDKRRQPKSFSATGKRS